MNKKFITTNKLFIATIIILVAMNIGITAVVLSQDKPIPMKMVQPENVSNTINDSAFCAINGDVNYASPTTTKVVKEEYVPPVSNDNYIPDPDLKHYIITPRSN